MYTSGHTGLKGSLVFTVFHSAILLQTELSPKHWEYLARILILWYVFLYIDLVNLDTNFCSEAQFTKLAFVPHSCIFPFWFHATCFTLIVFSLQCTLDDWEHSKTSSVDKKTKKEAKHMWVLLHVLWVLSCFFVVINGMYHCITCERHLV